VAILVPTNDVLKHKKIAVQVTHDMDSSKTEEYGQYLKNCLVWCVFSICSAV